MDKGILTSPEKEVYPNPADWERDFNSAEVHIQWDPERFLRGAKLQYRSIQVGIGSSLISEYVDDWIVSIKDMRPLVKKMRSLLDKGKEKEAKRLLPVEKVYEFKSSGVFKNLFLN